MFLFTGLGIISRPQKVIFRTFFLNEVIVKPDNCRIRVKLKLLIGHTRLLPGLDIQILPDPEKQCNFIPLFVFRLPRRWCVALI